MDTVVKKQLQHDKCILDGEMIVWNKTRQVMCEDMLAYVDLCKLIRSCLLLSPRPLCAEMAELSKTVTSCCAHDATTDEA